MKLPPRLALALRRSFVTAGVIGSLVIGAVTVRAAAAWTASAAPLESPPTSVSDISTRLVDVSARSAALEQQIVDLTARTADLAQALAAADKRVGTDSATAKTLRAQLAAAQKKLAALSKSLSGNSTKPKTKPASAPTPTHHENDD
jgi:16S rRNA G1207 methylase RsmC